MRLRNRAIAADAIVAPSARVSIDSLPNEILYRIIQFVGSDARESYSAFHHTSREPLLHAALVCRRWRHPAQETLFGWAKVDISASREAPWLALDPESRARVRSLVILDETVFAPTDVAHPGAAALLDSPHVHTLSITSTHSYWPYLYHLKALQRLHVSFLTHPFDDPASIDPSAAFPFQLDALALEITNDLADDSLVPIIPQNFVPVLAAACCRLTSLKLQWTRNDQPYHTAPILSQLQPILDASSTSLRHLHSSGEPPPIALYTAFGTAKECVHFEIAIGKDFLLAALEALAASGFCESLERLTIHPDYSTVSRDAMDEDAQIELIRCEEILPPSLLGLLKSAPFARLRHVSFPLHYWEDTLTLDEASREIVQDLEARGVAVFAAEDLPLY